jgi:hypothetical protein
VIEVFALWWPRLAYDPHARLALIEAPVYEALVGFFSQVPSTVCTTLARTER